MWALNSMTSRFISERRGIFEMETGESHPKKKRQRLELCRHSQGVLGPPAAGRDKEGLSPRVSGGCTALTIL